MACRIDIRFDRYVNHNDKSYEIDIVIRVDSASFHLMDEDYEYNFLHFAFSDDDEKQKYQQFQSPVIVEAKKEFNVSPCCSPIQKHEKVI